ncbi:DUF5808 domain-containing protein [Plantactinospora sp. WMMB334]|uniref:DUF5808 domain-containing protein n=1 Tax=Plantactinospora sp. WMMB334 TaxID=3404119 RepID=UPI003B923B0F
MGHTASKLIAAAAGALVGAAVAKELDKPPEQRTWHGDVVGVPYDFRPPTAEKLRRSMWNPDDSRLLVPHAFGMGWSINFAAVAALAAQARQEVDTADDRR